MKTKYYDIKKAYILNIITALMAAFSVAWMFSGITIGSTQNALTVARWKMLKFYTVDSNIIMGITAFYVALKQKSVLTGKSEKVEKSVYAVKLCGVVGVTLTMLVTAFFLVPTTKNGFVVLFSNSNFFLHLLNPLISLFTFLRYECTDELSLRDSFTGTVSMLIYAVYYLANCLSHIDGNTISPRYDWYGFFMFGIKSIYFVLPIIILVTYIISFVLWKINRHNAVKSK